MIATNIVTATRSAQDPGICTTCGAPMIATRSGNQVVCTHCDYFEVLGANPNAAPVAATVAADIARGAAPALATSQTVRELTAAEAQPSMAAESRAKVPARTVAPRTAKAPKPAKAEKPAAKPMPAPVAAPKAAAPAKRGAFAEELARTLQRAVDLSRRAAETFTLNAHPRVDEIVKMLTVAASGIESTIPHVDHYPANHVGIKPARATTPRAPRVPTGDAAIVLRFARANETFTLGALADHFVAYTEAPKKWTYAAEVKPESRHRWVASLASRRAVWPLVSRGLIQKISTGIYGITSEGAALAETAQAPEPVGPAYVPASKPAKAEKPKKEAKPKAAKKPAGKAAAKAEAKKPAKAGALEAGTKVTIKGDVPKGIAAVTTAKERANLVVRSVHRGKAAVQSADGGVRFEIEVGRLEAAS